MNIVFDLDGTLADTAHRNHFIERPVGKKDWDAWNKACVDDTPLPACQILCNAWWDGSEIQIWSGRSEEVRKETEDWLVKHLEDRANIDAFPWITHYENGQPVLDYGEVANPIILKLRPKKCYTPDNELKAQWLKESIEEGWTPGLVFEDRTRMVEMYRGKGIPCFQVAPGDF